MTRQTLCLSDLAGTTWQWQDKALSEFRTLLATWFWRRKELSSVWVFSFFLSFFNTIGHSNIINFHCVYMYDVCRLLSIKLFKVYQQNAYPTKCPCKTIICRKVMKHLITYPKNCPCKTIICRKVMKHLITVSFSQLKSWMEWLKKHVISSSTSAMLQTPTNRSNVYMWVVTFCVDLFWCKLQWGFRMDYTWCCQGSCLPILMQIAMGT